MKRALLLSSIAFGTLAIASVARTDPIEPIALVYEAPDECPRSNEFSRQLEARTRLVRVTDESPSRTIEVHLERAGNGILGRLVVPMEGGSRTRELRVHRCEDAVAALALIAAITIDPSASTAPIDALLASVIDAGTDAIEEDGAIEAEVDAAREEEASIVTAPAPTPSWLALEGFAGGGVLTGPIPNASAAISIGTAMEIGDRWYAPHIALDGVGTLSSQSSIAQGSAAFSAFFARLSYCPVRIGRAFEVRPCAGGRLGFVTANARGFVDAQSSLGMLGGVDLGARLAWSWRALVVALRVDAQFALARPRYYVDPARDVFLTEPVGVFASLDVGLRWMQ